MGTADADIGPEPEGVMKLDVLFAFHRYSCGK
jgi:hypothetical protein